MNQALSQVAELQSKQRLSSCANNSTYKKEKEKFRPTKTTPSTIILNIKTTRTEKLPCTRPTKKAL
ncbi:5826_t:CDS:2, partial [Gigaspora margarita]